MTRRLTVGELREVLAGVDEMLAAATNRDTDTLNALVDAYLDVTEQIPDPTEAAGFMSGVLITLVEGLYWAFRAADQVGGDRG